jgi:2-hydroxy-3-oxopropionate reductase
MWRGRRRCWRGWHRTRPGWAGRGRGQATKLIKQVLCGLGFLAVAEATALAEAAGVDVARIPQALRDGRADNALLQEYMPRFAARDYRRTGRIDNMVKDLDSAAELARQTRTAMPLTALCAEIRRLQTAAGLGAEDQAALMEFFRRPQKDATR